jgi:hypothetical protein
MLTEYEYGRIDVIDEMISYIKRQKANYGNLKIFDNQIKYLKALK